MRLTPEQIKQGILNADQDVRDACVDYFANSFSTDPEIAPLASQAIREHGWGHAFGMYSFLEKLVQTDESLAWLIDQLRQRGQPDGEEEADVTSWLLDALASAQPVLLKAHEEEIRGLEAVDEEVMEAIEEKIRLDELSPEELWRELEDFCEETGVADYLMDEEVDYANDVVEAMGRHSGIFNDRILDILSKNIDEYEQTPVLWLMGPSVVRLAGELRLQQAIPHVVRLLHEDEEILDPDCIRSLIKIGTDEVVEALADGYLGAKLGFRRSAAEIFEKVHSDRSVERCLALIDGEEDLGVACRLAEAAVMNFADEAIEPARQLVLTNDLDPDVIGVRSALLAATTLMGIEMPEADQWRKDAKHDVEFRRRWYAEHYLGNDDEEDDWDEEDKDWDEEDENYEDYDDEPLPPPATIVREDRKIGRNEPCPCGSGKKYKKCCMKKEDGSGLIE